MGQPQELDQHYEDVTDVGHRLLAQAVAHAALVSQNTWRAQSDAAAVCARYLACHPSVVAVSYPGLPNDPAHELAARTLTFGFGSTLAFELADGSVHALSCGACEPLELVATLERILSPTRKLV